MESACVESEATNSDHLYFEGHHCGQGDTGWGAGGRPGWGQGTEEALAWLAGLLRIP